MFRNYLKTAFRNILRQKGYAFINIIGLAVGLAATIMILLWVVNELSFNRNNQHFSQIYRLVQQQQYTSGPLTTPCMPGPLAADLKKDFPEFRDVFRFYSISGVLSVGEKQFAQQVSLADSGLFNVFSFHFLEGSPETALQPYTVILSKKGVKKYFGDEDPMGKIIRLDNKLSFRVNGVVEDPPENSSFTSELYLPFQHLEDLGWNLEPYGWNSYYIYAELEQNADIDQVNQKIEHYFRKVRNDENLSTILFLFPLNMERLYGYDGSPRLITTIYIFSLIAMFILLIACINFMNLSTARAAKRSREIGLRKVVGARRRQLIYQFLSESVLISILSLIVALVLVQLFLPLFNDLTSKELRLNFADPWVWAVLLAITLLTGLMAGSYPAFYLSAINPLKNIRKTSGTSGGNPWFRRSLVVFQFVLSVSLIISTIVIYRQLTYIHDKDLGMNKDNVAYAQLRGDLSKNFYDFKSRLMQNPGVLSVTRALHIPFYMGSNTGGLSWEGKDSDDDVLIGFERADYEYLKTMHMKLLDGRFFEPGYGTDTAAVVINEAAAKTMGMDHPVGKWIAFNEGRDRYNIIGLVKDFNFLPLNHEIEPMAFFYSKTNYNYLLVKVDGENTPETMDYMEQVWTQFLPDFPFEYKFLDEYYNYIYRDVTRLGRLIKYFAILAIIISCLGLLGLASFTAEQKTKEIGIRKVLGSSVMRIIKLQQREFFWLVLVANIIAWPLTWYFMGDWLDSYAYKISLSPLFFIIAGGLSLVITFLTVLILSYRAAVKNPVDAIKYE